MNALSIKTEYEGSEDLSAYSREHLEWMIEHLTKRLQQSEKSLLNFISLNSDLLNRLDNPKENLSKNHIYQRDGKIIYMSNLQIKG
jgi:hypothetical protein